MQPRLNSFQAKGGLEMGAKISAAGVLDPLLGCPSELCYSILELHGRKQVVVDGSLIVASA